MENTINRLGSVDPSSFSKPEELIIEKIHLIWDINFNERIVKGEAQLSGSRLQKDANELILDVRGLKIFSVVDKNDKALSFDVSPEVATFGSKLTIQIPQNDTQKCACGFVVKIQYETSPNASGLQWLNPNQTLNKKKPFLFSQFQAVHARSAVPCQDTPYVKMPYTAEVTAPDGITVLMSAVRIGEPELLSDGRKKFTFEQKVPIPSYLIAVVAGDLDSRKIGARSHVWAQPEMVDAAAYEFSETEEMIKAGENICGPYVWGIYDLIVLPPSFPFGGMENPCLTFITPTILAGDRSLASVVAHEISHSWTGNLVTNKNFEHFWLNEGFTEFLERKIIGHLKGPQIQDFEAITGINTLKETIGKLGENNPLTKLVLDLTGVHPDDSFSVVPYEKGHIFLRYLEEVVGGPEKFEPFLKDYIDEYKYKSIETDDFKNNFIKYFSSNENINSIDWDTWLYGAGMPPVIPKYDYSLTNACIALKDKWLSNCLCSAKQEEFSSNDLKNMSSRQIIYFLQLFFECGPHPIEKLELMDKVYNLSAYTNYEIKFRWLRIGLNAHWKLSLEGALQMVQEVGRMKFVRPLYQDMYKWEEARLKAIEVFEQHKMYMMYVNVYTIAQDLHLEN